MMLTECQNELECAVIHQRLAQREKELEEAREIISVLHNHVVDDWTATERGDRTIMRARAFLKKAGD